jgi:phenylacetic acid degradation operon negative regulatory protein
VVIPGEDSLERPLTARSIVASLLLGSHPPRQTSARLVRFCALLGVNENATRVALSRMVERGELRVTDGVYELAGAVRRRQAPQDWVLDPELPEWDGTWWLALVAAGRRSQAERVTLRAAASTVRLAAVREGVWARPANVPRASAPAAAWDALDEQCTWWDARPPDGPDLVTRLFAPETWAERAGQLIDRLTPVTAAIAAGAPDRLAEGFVLGAASLQHLRRDPLLPEPLLPRRWPGDDLRAAYRAYVDAYGPAVATYLR